MEGIYGWLRNITCYILFISVLDNLLPGKKYGKYLKLFAGMVLILLVLQPFTNGLRLEDQIAHNYEAFVFRNQADDLKQEIFGMEEQRLEQMISQYEEAVGQDLSQMAVAEGLISIESLATICRETESEQFGMVTEIWMQVRGENSLEQPTSTTESTNLNIETMEPVKQVVVGERSTEAPADLPEMRKEQELLRAAVAKLRRKIASYYNLEETYVEIQVVERQAMERQG